MAKKLLDPLEDPPVASSSEDDGVEISSDEGEEQISGSSSEENKPKDPSTKTLKTPSTATKQSSDSDSGSEADSEPEAQPSSKAITVSAVKSKNKESKDTPAVKSGKKRAGEGTSTEVNAKKAKKGEENKKSHFQRLWSEEDEISLLQGMIDYKADTGKSPYDDMNGFFEFMKKAISFEVSKVQFGDKIRGLKKKYLGKSKKGKEVIFTKAHDKNCLKLATHIWGSDGLGLESAVKSPVQSKKKVDSVVESAAVKSPVPSKKKVDSVVESAAVKSPVQSKKKVDSVVESAAVKSPVQSKKKVDSVVESAAVKSPVPSKKKVDSVVESAAVKSPVQSKKKVDSMVESSAVKSPRKNEKKKMDSMVEEDKERLGSDGIVLESAKSNGKVSNVESLEPEGEKVEEDKEVLIHGGGSESPSWFEKSFLFESIMSFGVDEQCVKQRWSKVPVETKKRIEEKLKIVQAKEFDLLMMKTEIMRDASTVLCEAI
ncbi:putative transcription factor [Cardamine amara subsp. amara]|uniref:Transcription factor n=1 Tax=Cardamine amara subsp. amara TaxID=228776 RepID=A0ABD1A259_CARAN